MAAHRTPSRSAAQLRLVRVVGDGATIVVDGIVSSTDGRGRWPESRMPVSLHLEPPEARWLADALTGLLTSWAEDDALVAALLVESETHVVARVSRDQAQVSLELRSAS